VHSITYRREPLLKHIVQLAVADDGYVYVGANLDDCVLMLPSSLEVCSVLYGATPTLKGIAVHADTLFVLQRSFERDVDQVHVYDRNNGEPLTQYALSDVYYAVSMFLCAGSGMAPLLAIGCIPEDDRTFDVKLITLEGTHVRTVTAWPRMTEVGFDAAANELVFAVTGIIPWSVLV
jgi:hypothetical protein